MGTVLLCSILQIVPILSVSSLSLLFVLLFFCLQVKEAREAKAFYLQSLHSALNFHFFFLRNHYSLYFLCLPSLSLSLFSLCCVCVGFQARQGLMNIILFQLCAFAICFSLHQPLQFSSFFLFSTLMFLASVAFFRGPLSIFVHPFVVCSSFLLCSPFFTPPISFVGSFLPSLLFSSLCLSVSFVLLLNSIIFEYLFLLPPFVLPSVCFCPSCFPFLVSLFFHLACFLAHRCCKTFLCSFFPPHLRF